MKVGGGPRFIRGLGEGGGGPRFIRGLGEGGGGPRFHSPPPWICPVWCSPVSPLQTSPCKDWEGGMFHHVRTGRGECFTM